MRTKSSSNKILVGAAAVLWCLAVPLSGFGATVNVSIVNFAFVPATVNINVGDTVVWTWPTGSSTGYYTSSYYHNVTSTSAPQAWPASATLTGPATFSNKFTTAGTFPYECTVHLFTGQINVASISNTNLWPGAANLGNGWMNSSWFGTFNVNNYPWIYHQQHGWMYVFGTDPTSIWLYTSDLGFLWTSQSVYPWLWSDTQKTWLYYDVGSSNPRYFYNWNSQKWVAVNP
jgi:plastocyanin